MIRKSPDIYPFDLVQLVTLQQYRKGLQEVIDSGIYGTKTNERLRQEIAEVGDCIFNLRYSAKFQRIYETVGC